MAALRATMSLRPTQVSLRVRTNTVRAVRPVAVRASTRRVVFAAADKEAVLSDVRAIIAEQLGTDLDKVAADSKFADLGADSLDTVEIMMALEEKFDITLDEEGAEKISTVGEAAEMITAQMD
eukprot:jgi/Tetstr1/457911/TSEL_044429.t1